MNKYFTRPASAALALVIFSTQCAFAHLPETSLWKIRRQAREDVSISKRPAGLIQPTAPPSPFQRTLSALPLSAGTVRSAMPARQAGKIVVHIQDIHRNREAQRNISTAIRALVDAGVAPTLVLEGAFAPIDLRALRAGADHRILEAVADYSLEANDISGPIHAALLSTSGAPNIVGAEEKALYDGNVDAYKAASARASGLKDLLSAQRAALETKKRALFSSRLTAFDRAASAYHAGRLTLGAFIGETRRAGVPLTTSLEQFEKAWLAEQTLDFRRVERERNALLTRLVPKLSASEQERLTRQTRAFQTGAMSHGVFYDGLARLCDDNGVPLSGFPAFRHYLGYALASEALAGDQLFADILRAEDMAFTHLATTAEETALIRESRRLGLTEKLLRFALTPAEWNAYAELTSAEPRADVKPFEDFYRFAEQRDDVMARNVLESSDGVTVLVTGGFHAAGIRRRLEQAGVSLISFTPRVTATVADGSAYLGVFNEEKTPLEQMFAGEKLHLAAAPVSEAERTLGLPLKLALLPPAILAGSAALTQMINGRRWIASMKATRAGAIREFFVLEKPTDTAPLPPSSIVYNILMLAARSEIRKSDFAKIFALGTLVGESPFLVYVLSRNPDFTVQLIGVVTFFAIDLFIGFLTYPQGRFQTNLRGRALSSLTLPALYVASPLLIEAYGMKPAMIIVFLFHLVVDSNRLYHWDGHFGSKYTLRYHEPETRALDLDSGLIMMKKVQLAGAPYAHRGDGDAPVSVDSLTGRRRRRAERAQNNLREILEIMRDVRQMRPRDLTPSGGLTAKDIADMIENDDPEKVRIAVVAVEDETTLLVSEFLSSSYGWGLVRSSRSRQQPVLFISLNRLAQLTSAKERRWAAFRLAAAALRNHHYKNLREGQISAQHVSEEMVDFDADMDRREQKFFKGMYVRFMLKHTWTVVVDRAISVVQVVKIWVLLRVVNFKGRKVRRSIEGILTSNKFVDINTRELDRLEAQNHFLPLRDDLHAIFQKFIRLSYLAMRYGMYDTSSWIMDWSRYFSVVDTKMMPMQQLTLIMRNLIRTGKYGDLIEMLQNIKDKKFVLRAGGRKVIVPLLNVEVELLLQAAGQRKKGETYQWAAMMERQIQASQDPGNQMVITSAMQEATRIFAEIEKMHEEAKAEEKAHPIAVPDLSKLVIFFPPTGFQFRQHALHAKHEIVRLKFKELARVAREILGLPNLDLVEFFFRSEGGPADEEKRWEARSVAVAAYQIALWELIRDRLDIYEPSSVAGFMGAGLGSSALLYATGVVEVRDALLLAKANHQFNWRTSRVSRRVMRLVSGVPVKQLAAALVRVKNARIAVSFPDGSFAVSIHEDGVHRLRDRIRILGGNMDGEGLPFSSHDAALVERDNLVIEEALDSFLATLTAIKTRARPPTGKIFSAARPEARLATVQSALIDEEMHAVGHVLPLVDSLNYIARRGFGLAVVGWPYQETFRVAKTSLVVPFPSHSPGLWTVLLRPVLSLPTTFRNGPIVWVAIGAIIALEAGTAISAAAFLSGPIGPAAVATWLVLNIAMHAWGFWSTAKDRRSALTAAGMATLTALIGSLAGFALYSPGAPFLINFLWMYLPHLALDAWILKRSGGVPALISAMNARPLSVDLNKVLGATWATPELKVVQIDSERSAEVQMGPVAAWLAGGEGRQAIFYLTPRGTDAETLSAAVRRVWDPKRTQVPAQRVSFQWHTGAPGSLYSLEEALSGAFGTLIPLTSVRGLPSTRLKAQSTRITWIRTTAEGWQPLQADHVDLGASIRIPLRDIVGFLADVLALKALLIDLEREMRAFQSAAQAA